MSAQRKKKADARQLAMPSVGATHVYDWREAEEIETNRKTEIDSSPLPSVSGDVFRQPSRFYIHSRGRAVQFDDEAGADGVIVLSSSGQRLVMFKWRDRDRYRFRTLPMHPEEHPFWLPQS